MKTRSDLAAERVRELLDYDQDTGIFRWRVRRCNVRMGRQTGYLTKYGYLLVGVDHRTYMAHRLAWLYVHGEWPTDEVDHINGNRSDNRIANLRVVSKSVNQQNVRSSRRGNSSGLLGAHVNKDAWCAHIWVGGKNLHLGRFKTPEEAHAAYMKAKRELHEGCTI